MDIGNLTGSDARKLIREGKWRENTVGMAIGAVQANLVTLPKELSLDFMIFCQRNPKPCPIIDITEPGSPVPVLVAPEADLRTDIPLYHVYRNGVLSEVVTDITPYWRDDFVSFLIGCSLTFERSLLEGGVPLRHIEMKSSMPVFITNIDCLSSRFFSGKMVVTMRPIPSKHVARAIQITSRYPLAHGAPVHIGNPGSIGIKDISKPDMEEAVPIYDDDVLLFWACGVTPQIAVLQSRPEIMITHAPGHAFVTDLLDAQLMV